MRSSPSWTVSLLSAEKSSPGLAIGFIGIDPRAVKLLDLVRRAQASGVVSGRFARIGTLIEQSLERRKGRGIPMNIDGATAVIYSELGFAPPLGRGLFVLSRSVGILAHAWEQTQQGGRIKGPMPPQDSLSIRRIAVAAI